VPVTQWPGESWTTGAPAADVNSDRLGELIRSALDQPATLAVTLGFVAIHRGELVVEAYGPDTDATTTLISWSMAKSITQSLFGLLVADGLIDVDAPAPVGAWANDARRDITIRQLLQMSSGLEFVEDYVDAGVSHVIEMLFGSGASDHSAYAASFPLVHKPGAVWNYSSGTTNILARIAGNIVGGGRAGMESYLRDRLFGPLGMSSAQPKFDEAGTFVGSSFVYATARDFARYGYLYLHDGMWDGTRVLPAGWVESARRAVTAEVGADETHGYGEHWWHWRNDPSVLMASGYEMQRIIVEPARDLVVVRLGKTPAESAAAVDAWLDEVRNCFPAHA
jgi:CubicO group peptidase (beta-lactamase class C family)